MAPIRRWRKGNYNQTKLRETVATSGQLTWNQSAGSMTHMGSRAKPQKWPHDQKNYIFHISPLSHIAAFANAHVINPGDHLRGTVPIAAAQMLAAMPTASCSPLCTGCISRLPSILDSACFNGTFFFFFPAVPQICKRTEFFWTRFGPKSSINYFRPH